MNIEAIEAIVQRRTMLKEQLEVIENQIDALDDLIKAELPVGVTKVAGLRLSITCPARWTAETKAKFVKAHPATHYPDFYCQQLDTKAVEKYIAPAELDEYKPRGDTQLRVS